MKSTKAGKEEASRSGQARPLPRRASLWVSCLRQHFATLPGNHLSCLRELFKGVSHPGFVLRDLPFPGLSKLNTDAQAAEGSQLPWVSL